MKSFICDVDGTIALRGQRSPFDYKRVLEDSPNEAVIHVVQALIKDGWNPIFVTGREDFCREDTELFIRKYVCEKFALHMRKSGDYRPDDAVKSELFLSEISPYTVVSLVLDDRDKTVSMWRSVHSLTTLQVAEGNF